MKFVAVLLYLMAALLLTRAGIASPGPPPTLETVQHRAFDFFWNESNPKTGLTKDRARNIGGKPDTYTVASIASTGYALAALPVGVSHGWVSKKTAYARALTTLRFVQDKMETHHGFYYHFVDKTTGARVWNCELSSVDTALLLLGARVAGNYWPRTEVQRLAEALTDRADWQWMQCGNGKHPEDQSLSMGWKPETGWLGSRWQGYSEASFLYWLALGSRTHPLAPSAWDAWEIKTADVEGISVLGGPQPLFMAQMAPGFYNLRGLRDRQGRNWWVAWRNIHLADRAYCTRNPDGRRTYAEGFWGISANDQPPPVGYGANAPTSGRNDGTVSPTVMLAGVLFLPSEAQTALTNLWQKHGTQLWGRYGFSNAFNVDKNWYDQDVIGIDLGMLLLAIENHQTGLVWRLLDKDLVTQRGRKSCGAEPSRSR